MGEMRQHVVRAEQNGQLAAELALGDGRRLVGATRWAVVVAHYAAREWVHALLAQHPRLPLELQHPGTHPTTHHAFGRCLPATDRSRLGGYLQSLYDLSSGARYIDGVETSDSWWSAGYGSAQAAAEEAVQMAEQIRHFVEGELP